MLMDAGLDTGDMLMKAETPIGENENYGELFLRLADIGADLLDATLKAMDAGTITREKQDDSLSVYAPMLDKTMSPIDWSKPAQAVHNQIRGLCPWPVAATAVNGKTLKVYASLLCEGLSGQPGEVLESGKRLVIACGTGAVELVQVQYDGGKRMAAQDFLRGHPVEVGKTLPF